MFSTSAFAKKVDSFVESRTAEILRFKEAALKECRLLADFEARDECDINAILEFTNKKDIIDVYDAASPLEKSEFLFTSFYSRTMLGAMLGINYAVATGRPAVANMIAASIFGFLATYYITKDEKPNWSHQDWTDEVLGLDEEAKGYKSKKQLLDMFNRAGISNDKVQEMKSKLDDAYNSCEGYISELPPRKRAQYKLATNNGLFDEWGESPSDDKWTTCQDLFDSGRLNIFHETPLTEQLEDIFNNQIDTSEADAMLDDFF
jgi:hypothetical protein